MVRTMFERKPGKRPTLGTIFQCIDRIRKTKLNEGLSADNTSGPTGTMQHYCRLRIWNNLVNAQRKFAIGTATCTGYMHLLVF